MKLSPRPYTSKLLLYSHGNGELIDDNTIQFLDQLGDECNTSVVGYDYRYHFISHTIFLVSLLTLAFVSTVVMAKVKVFLLRLR